MNILVIGGGEYGKFGNDFVTKAREDGHRVLVLSHRRRADDPDQVIANFTSTNDIIEKVNFLCKSVDQIDIMLYNTSADGEPRVPIAYTSGGIINESLYLFNFRLHAVIPHAIANTVMEYMRGGKMIFITTDMIHDRERSKYLENVGYCGGKAFQHQLMLALAEYNDRNLTVSSISPFFDYNNKECYKSVFDAAYNYIFDHGEEMNGKIFECFD